MTVYLLTVNSLRIGTNNFVRLYVQATIAHKISQKGGISFVDELYLRTLHKPYMTYYQLVIKTFNPLWKDNCG